MGKTKWNGVETKPKRSGVYKVLLHVPPQYDEQDSGPTFVEGFAWFDSMRKRWGGVRQCVRDARESSDTVAGRFGAGQEKEWVKA